MYTKKHGVKDWQLHQLTSVPPFREKILFLIRFQNLKKQLQRILYVLRTILLKKGNWVTKKDLISLLKAHETGKRQILRMWKFFLDTFYTKTGSSFKKEQTKNPQRQTSQFNNSFIFTSLTENSQGWKKFLDYQWVWQMNLEQSLLY